MTEDADVPSNVYKLAQQKGRKKSGTGGPPKTEEEDKRPVVRLTSGNLVQWVKESEDALIASGEELYKQDGRLVRPIWQEVMTAGGNKSVIIRLANITEPYLLGRLSAVARYEKWNVEADDFITCNCPRNVAETYIANDGLWNVRFLLGVVTAPTLRPDGSVIEKPGYDEATQLLFNPLGVAFPKVPEAPTKEDALRAVELLKEPVRDYPLDGNKLAVYLSAVLTTVIRRALPAAPMHAYSASGAGSGKSMLVDLASIIATGFEASVTSTGNDGHGDAELEKRLTSSMLAGDAVLSLDNLETPLRGELLCQLLTQTNVKLRPLGKSINVSVPVTTSFFATGNNLTVVGDLTRRVLVATFNVEEERPELRRFDFNPLQLARQKRAEYVIAALVIIRAYLLSGENIDTVPLGSYETWNKLVRESLIWAGVGDPVAVLDEVRANDPRLIDLTNVMHSWAESFGEQFIPIDQVVRAAMQAGDDGALLRPALKEAMVSVAGQAGHINTKRFSFYLKRNKDRIIDGMKFVERRGGRFVEWALLGAESLAGANNVPLYEAEGNYSKKPGAQADMFGDGGAARPAGGIDPDDEIPF